MALSCEQHTAFLYDRGGQRQIGALTPLARVHWERKRDDMSMATVYIATTSPECNKALGLAEAGRAELVIFRGGMRVWEGPITRISYMGNSAEIEAHDVMHYCNRTIMHNEYDSRYPNNGLVLDRLKRILNTEMARKEALDPPINFLQYIQYIYTTSTNVKDAGTAAHTLPYESTVFDHIDNYAANGGLDYTVVGRSLILYDVHSRIGQTAMVTGDDFIGDPVITQYGMDLATYVAMTDGKGHWGDAGGIDPYYGEWEKLYQAYDENAVNADPSKAPTVAELASQAERTYVPGKRPPLVVRIPDNTTLNPNGVLSIPDLVPGVWIPLSANLPGRSVSQMQKLDSMSVDEAADTGEVISVVLSPAPMEQDFVEATE